MHRIFVLGRRWSGRSGRRNNRDLGRRNRRNPCLNNCKNAMCGDGILWTGQEDCDDGAGNAQCGPKCTTTCDNYVAQCGNDCPDPGEACGDVGACAPGFTCSNCLCEDTPTGIELLTFEALGLDGRIEIVWSTATEAGNAGFYVLRAGDRDGEYERITGALIPAAGDEFTGAEYAIVDTDVEAGDTYFYVLEDVDIHGASTYHGPVDATVEPGRPFGCGMAFGL